MTLQNVHVQRGKAGIVVCATWLQAPPACEVAAAVEAGAALLAHDWLQEKLKAWKAGS
jgi:hypothetical protein